MNVSVDAEILKVAKEMKINLSQTFEDTLRERTKDERIRRWREENKEAIDSTMLISSATVFSARNFWT